MTLFFGRTEQRTMQSWIDADGFVRRPSETRSTYLAPVFAAIRHIVDFGSTLPVDAYRKITESDRAPSSMPRMIARQNEPGGLGLEAWLGQIFYGMAVHGNAVGWVTDYDGYGYPVDAIWLARNEWEWSKATKQWSVFGAPVPASRILHIPWLVPPGERLGMSPIEHYASVTSAGLSAQEYADVKRGGGLPPTILKNTERTFDATVAETVSDRLATRLAAGKPFAHGKDWELAMPAIPPNHTSFIETLKLTANQIASIYGIDPTEIGGEAGNSLTYSTEELRQIRRGADMRPYLTRVENGLTRVLPNRQYLKFNLDATVRVDIKTRTEVDGAKVLDGRLSVDEAREHDDLAPVPGGDRHNVPAPKQEPITR